MNFKHKWLTTVGVAGAALFLAACSNSSSSGSKSKSITLSTDSEISTMDLSKSTALGTFNMLNNTEEGLYRLGKNSKTEKAIATKLVKSKDGKTYTITLRHGVKWSNGDKVTAKDFVYSWRRTVDPKTKSQYGYLFSGIKNADQIQDSKKAASTLGIKAIGNYKLKITLEEQIPYFKLLLGFPVFFPQDQKVVEKYGSKYGTRSDKMVYDGPFKLSKWNGTSTAWKLTKNSTYWDKKDVKLSTINYQVVKDPQTGLNQYNSKKLIATNITGNQSKNLKNKKSLTNLPTSSSYYLSLNQKMKLFKNLKIREAISMAVNRKTLTKQVLGDGSFSNGSFVSKGLAVNPKTGKDFTSDTTTPSSMTYNPTKAKKLWKEGLKETGISNPHITLLAGNSSDTEQVTQYLQSTLEKNLPGLKITNKNIPSQTVLAEQSTHSFQMTLSDWFADFSDPITFLNILTTNNASNQPQWSNKEYDKLIKASSTTDANKPEARWNDMVKAQNILLKDQGITPLYQSGSPWMISSSFKGWIYNSAGANWNLKGAYTK